MKMLFSEIISPLYALFEQKSFVFPAICHWVKNANVFHWVLWNYIKHKWWLSIRLSININLRLMGWKDFSFLILFLWDTVLKYILSYFIPMRLNVNGSFGVKKPEHSPNQTFHWIYFLQNQFVHLLYKKMNPLTLSLICNKNEIVH